MLPGAEPGSWVSASPATAPLAKFTGENCEDGETFRDWVEQCEMVATACQWDDQTNLVTRLRAKHMHSSYTSG